jgi:hypothetical protein
LSILTISHRNDNIPFRVCIETQIREPRHAIITDLETGKNILGKFLLFPDYPEAAGDIKEYEVAISQDTRKIVYEWAYDTSNRFEALCNNWEALNTAWEIFNVLPYVEW